MDFEAAFGPDEEVGEEDFLFDGPLGLKTLFDLAGGPAAGMEALVLRGGGTGDTDGGIELLIGSGLEQEGDDHHGEGLAFRAPGVDLGEPEPANAGMEDSFKLLARERVAENLVGEDVAAEEPLPGQNMRAEAVLDCGQGGLAGSDELAGQLIGVRDGDVTAREELGAGRFAHADSAREAEDPHNRARDQGVSRIVR